MILTRDTKKKKEGFCNLPSSQTKEGLPVS